MAFDLLATIRRVTVPSRVPLQTMCPNRPIARPLRLTAVLGAVLCLAGLVLSCGGGGGGGAVSPFYVIRTRPVGGALSVSVHSRIHVLFSMPVSPESLGPGSLAVAQISGDVAIPGETQVDEDDPTGSALVWTPTAGMAPGAVHRCRVATDLLSVDGDPVGDPLTFSFWTEGEDALGIPDAADLRTLPDGLNIGRREHTATLLFNGQVLVAGGYTQSTSITDRAELYAGGSFVEVADRMEHERASHTATRLADGRVLLAGGWYERALGDVATTAHAEVYDPSTGLFEAVGAMTQDRADHAALLLPDDRVLVTGGSYLEGEFLWDLESAEVFDPVANTFEALPDPMVHTRATHAMVDTREGKFVLAGGSDDDGRPSFFDVATLGFEPLDPPLGEGQRWGPAAGAFYSGNVCIAGGDQLGTVLHVSHEDGRVRNTSSGLTVPRWYATGTPIGPDRVFVAGGYDFNRGLFVLHSTDIVIEGGINGSSSYATGVVFPTPMVNHTATRLLDGTVLFCGGLNVDGGAPELDGAYILTP